MIMMIYSQKSLPPNISGSSVDQSELKMVNMKRSMWLYFFASVVRQKEKYSVMYSIKGFCICANSRTYGYIAYCLQTPQTFCDFWSWYWHYKKVSFLKGEYWAHFLHWNHNSKFWVTWPRMAQPVYFLREMCLFFNFWMIKVTIMSKKP